MIVAATGHRPNKLAPLSICYSTRVLQRLIDLATAYLEKSNPDAVISGMALGWDTAIAIAAIKLNIPLTAAVNDKRRFYRVIPKYSGNNKRKCGIINI